MTGIENIVFCGDLYGVPRSVSKERAQELLDLVGLSDAADRKVQTYSGGMRRRLEVACGLINHPRLLFLDEPTLGLDVQTRTAVWEYIRKLKEDYGMTLFMTTHYLEEADGICDRIAIIDHGKIVKIGAPADLKTSLGRRHHRAGSEGIDGGPHLVDSAVRSCQGGQAGKFGLQDKGGTRRGGGARHHRHDQSERVSRHEDHGDEADDGPGLPRIHGQVDQRCGSGQG